MKLDKLQQLEDILAALKNNSWPGDTSELFGHADHLLAFQAFNGSTDSARAFLASRLPGWFWTIIPHINMEASGPLKSSGWVCRVWTDGRGSTESADCPAKAMLIAMVSALIAECEEAK